MIICQTKWSGVEDSVLKETSLTRRYAMADERAIGQWHVEWKPGGAPQVVDSEENCVAVVHGPNDQETLNRAMLFAAAPELRDGAWLSLNVFDGMAQDSTDPDVKAAAAKIIPILLSALVAAGNEISKAEVRT